MPRGDGTGPMGYGLGTGRGIGYCYGYPAPGYVHPGMGWGRGAFDRGWGFRRPMWGPPAPVAVHAGYPTMAYAPIDEAAALRQEAQYLSDALESIKKRIADIEGENKDRD